MSLEELSLKIMITTFFRELDERNNGKMARRETRSREQFGLDKVKK